jgi:hypothetical protein
MKNLNKLSYILNILQLLKKIIKKNIERTMIIRMLIDNIIQTMEHMFYKVTLWRGFETLCIVR